MLRLDHQGRKGDTILRLQEMTASRIIIDQNVPQNAPRHVIISGPSLHSVSSAVQLVQEVMANGPPWRHKMPSVHAQWNVNQGQHPRSPYQLYGPPGSLSTSSAPAPQSPSPHTGNNHQSPGMSSPTGPLPHASNHSRMSGWHQQQHVPFTPLGQPPSYAYYQAVPPMTPHSGSQMHTPPSGPGGWMPQAAYNSPGWTGTGAYYPPQGSSASSATTQTLPPATEHSASNSTSSDLWQEARTPEGYVYFVNKTSGATTWYPPTTPKSST